MCLNCKKVLRHINRIIEETTKALDVVDEKALQVCVNAGDAVETRHQLIEDARVIVELPVEKLIQEQIRAVSVF